MFGDKFSWRKAFASVMGATVLLVGVPALTVSAAGVDDFPYRGTVNKLDPWGFYTGYCTSFAAFRLSQEGVVLHGASLKGPNGKTAFFGTGGTWDAAEASIGYVVDTHPSVGSVAVWHGGEDHAWWGGHVAYVMAVDGAGNATLEEYNWSNYLRYGQRTTRAPRYIHFVGAGVGPAGLTARTAEPGWPAVSHDRLRSAAFRPRHRVPQPGHSGRRPAHHGGLPGPFRERHQGHRHLGPPQRRVLCD